MNVSRSRADHGFTLVEMLVVITIIAILVALLIPTVGMVIGTSKTAATSLEIDQLAQAIQAYKMKNNDFPPDFTNDAAVAAHVRLAYPRNQRNVATWLATLKTAASTASTGEAPDPAEALVFWLSQVRNNPRDPRGTSGDFVSFFEFDQTRLVDLDGDGLREYMPKHALGAPYVYFDGRVLSGACLYRSAYYPYPATSKLTTALSVARPYRSNQTIDSLDNQRTQPQSVANATKWIEPNKFQILCAGLDNHFGSAFQSDPNAQGYPIFKQFPVPNYNLAEEDRDNLANFSGGKTIGDSVP